MKTVDVGDRGEVIVKIDGYSDGNQEVDRSWMWPTGSGNKIWRESSIEFWRSGNERGGNGEMGMRADASEDPPSKVVGQFLNKQRAASGQMSLDMDELGHDDAAESTLRRLSTSKELKISFQAPSSNKDDVQSDEDAEEETRLRQHHNRRRSSNLPTTVDDDGDGEVLKCTSFQRRPSISRTKTKSRLIDPPEPPDRKSEGLGQVRSGILGKASEISGKPLDDEEDDPLLDEDIPEEYKRQDFSVWTLLEWVSLILILTAWLCTISIPEVKDRKLWGLQLWKWEVLVLVMMCGRLVSGWAIRIVVFFIERNFLLRKRVLYFVYGVRKAVQNCIWLGLVIIAWRSMFDKNVESGTEAKIIKYMNDILLCLLVGTLLWLVKTLMVKVLASSFHVSTFFDRIQESLFNQYVIETLSGPPLVEIENTQKSGATVPHDLKERSTKSGSWRGIGSGKIHKTGRVISSTKKQDEGISIDHLHRWNPNNISAWNMKRLMRIVRQGLQSTLDEQILDSTYEDESARQIRSEFEAKVAARKIFQNVAMHGSKFIYPEDLMRFMLEDEALKTMNLLGGSSEGEKISKSALKSWVVNAFRERRALALTLNDTKTAVNKLHQMVNVLVGIIILIITLIILEIATSEFLLFVSSQVVVVAFVFGNTCKTIFEAIVFLFVMHPFDVGDRCEIDDVQFQMIVEEMNILTTVFLRFDNQKIIYPNSTLSTKYIGNYYRSPDMGDSIEFHVHIATPAEKIAIMKQRITSYIDNKKEHWYSPSTVVSLNMEDLNELKIAIWIRHKMNHQDMGERWARRALVIEEMVKIFNEIDMEYRLLPFDINIRSMPPVSSTRLPSNWTTSND